MTKDINCMSGRCRFASKIYSDIIKHYGQPQSIIELGCGNGLNLSKFSTTIRRVGIDPFEPNIVAAKKNCPDCEIFLDCHLKLNDFADKEFDVGFTCSVLNHIENYEMAMDQLIRVCKFLYLLEPTIPGENRQALASETSSPLDTWYFDYENTLKRKSISFRVEKAPLYKENSGPLYHAFYVDCH